MASFGLKEAYAVLQKDHLDLQNHCLTIRQDLMTVQNDYYILKKLHEELKQERDKHQDDLVEKLQRSYDIYNEKCMEIEVLQKKLEDLKISENTTNQNKTNFTGIQKTYTDIPDQQSPQSRNHFESTITKALEVVGLFLEKTDEGVAVDVFDSEKLGELFGGRWPQSVVHKVNDLEETNAILQEAMRSLKQHNENQNIELSNCRKELQKKSDKCSNLQKEIQGMKKQGKKKKKGSVQVNTTSSQDDGAKKIITTGSFGAKTVVIEHKALQTIFSGLKEMSEFTTELKKTISDQNSWIDMLVSTMAETKTVSSGTKNDKSSCSYRRKSKKHVDTSDYRRKPLPDSGTKRTGFNNHELAENPSQDITPYLNYAGVFSTGRNVTDDSKPLDVSDNRFEWIERLEPNNDRTYYRRDTARLASQKTSSEDYEVYTEHDIYQPFGTEIHTVNPVMSSLWDKRHENQASRSNHDMCPMCEFIFDESYGVEKRRSHINGHFNI